MIGVFIQREHLGTEVCQEGVMYRLELCCHKQRTYQKPGETWNRTFPRVYRWGMTMLTTWAQTYKLDNCEAITSVKSLTLWTMIMGARSLIHHFSYFKIYFVNFYFPCANLSITCGSKLSDSYRHIHNINYLFKENH